MRIGSSLALRSNGTLVAWGENGRNQLAVPSGNDFVEIAAGGDIRADGSLVGWGEGSIGQTAVPPGNDVHGVIGG